MRIAFVGAGGVGGYFGGRLAAAGADVVFLARGAHLAALRADGLRIESPLGDTHVRVRAEDDPAAIGPVDLVIIAVKLWDTEAVVREITPLVGPTTTVMSLQNGVVKDDILRAAFGADRTIGGLCYILSVIARPGVIRHTGPMQHIVVGEFDGRASARVEKFADLCRRAAIDITISDTIERAIWEKFVFLVGLSGATTAIRQSIGPIRANPRARAFLTKLFAETAAVGRAQGIALPDDLAADRLAICDTLPAEFTSSMYEDRERGNRLEVPWLQGAVSRIGREHGVSTPANDFIGDVLAVYFDGTPAAVSA